MTEIISRRQIQEGSNMANFCTNCGNKLGKDDNFCTNCGTKIDKDDINRNNHLFESSTDSIEKEKAKKELKRVVGGRFSFNKTFGNELLKNGLDIFNTGNAIRQQVEKEINSGQIKSGGVEFRVNQLIHEYRIEKEEEKKKLKMIDEIFESEEIKSEIRKNKIDQIHVKSIKDQLKNKIITQRENMSEQETKYFIKKELEKAGKEQEQTRIAKEKEMNSKKIKENKVSYGGYCSLSCIHYYEEFLDSGGSIVGDFDSEGYVEYYCRLGHPLVDGRYCKDYE